MTGGLLSFLIILASVCVHKTKDPLFENSSEDYAVIYIHRIAKSTNAGVKY